MKIIINKALEWIKTKLVFPPVVSNKQVAGHKVGQHIIPFQESVITDALIKNKDVFIGFSRQISKSSLYSWIVLYLMQSYPCAGVTMGPTFGQAGVLFRALKAQIEYSFPKEYKVREEWIEHKKTGSTVRKVYNSPAANIGQMALQFIVCDEICLFDNIARQNLLTLLAGLGMTGDKPLLLYASNPPIEPDHWSLDFLKKLETDPNTSFYDFSAHKKADIQKASTWAQANPFIAEYLKSGDKVYKRTFDFYKEQAHGAKQNNTLELDFRRQLLGQRVAQDASRFCDVERIGVCDDSIFTDKSIRWSLGIDLAWKFDFTAFALMGFNQDTESLYIKPFLFMANTEQRRPGQAIQLNEWDRLGLIKVFRTDTMPREPVFSAVQDFIADKDIKIEKVVADPALAKQFELETAFDRLEFVLNSPRKMTGAIRYLQKIIHDRKCFFIGDNPAGRSHFNNAVVSEKSKDYCGLDRASTWDSIDLVVASTLALKHLSEHKRQDFKPFFIGADGVIHE